MTQIKDTSSKLHQGSVTSGKLQTVVSDAAVTRRASVQLTPLAAAWEGLRAAVRDEALVFTYSVVLSTSPQENCERRPLCRTCDSSDPTGCTGPFSTWESTTVAVSVSPSSARVSVVSPASGQLVFGVSNWNVPQVVTVAVAHDAVDEGVALLSLVRHTSSSTDSYYDGAYATFSAPRFTAT